MVKNELISEVTERTIDILQDKITKKQVEAVLAAYRDCVVENLMYDKTEKIPLPGIGNFTAKHVKARDGVSPINGQAWHNDAEDQLVLKISKGVKILG